MIKKFWAKNIGLSAKLLVLTIAFVMLAEIFIFVPSVSNFRVNWLKERLGAAQIAALAVEAARNNELPEKLREELLKNAKVHAVVLRRTDSRRILLRSDMPTVTTGRYDLRNASAVELILDALTVYFSSSNQMISVLGEPGFEGGPYIEIVVPLAPLKADMIHFGLKIFGLSVIISLIAAALVYLSLNALLVRPMRRITHNMVHFGKDPEDPGRIITLSGRSDEVGTAERELAAMQRQLADTLQQKNHLAALGLAVSKINHDLRNMLANAQLISDRFGTLEDPTVQRFAPKLIASLDRAIRLCSDTLRYGKAREATPKRACFALKPLVEEVGESLNLPRAGRIAWAIDIENELEVHADRDQLYRALSNLCRNAYQAIEAETRESGEDEIRVKAVRHNKAVTIEVRDTGPGLPKQAREHLFDAFQGVVRKGGTGLGLAISAELIRAHGGQIELLDSGGGTTFRIEIPDGVEDQVKKRRTHRAVKGNGASNRDQPLAE